jgi:hypothetical protein
MTQWKNIASVVALSISAALAGAGCLAQSADDEASNEPGAAPATPAHEAAASDPEAQAKEQTGDAQEACFGGWGSPGFGPFGCGVLGSARFFPGLAFGGCGGGCGGW